MNNLQLIERLNAVEARAKKIEGEVKKLLEALGNAGELPAEVESAMTRVETAIGTVDDLNPDETTDTPAEPPTT